MSESENNTYFETLQVSPTAEPEVIAAAYRALAKKYHPDRSEASDAPTRMARINVAFQALRTRVGRVTAAEVNSQDLEQDLPRDFSARMPEDHVDPNASLEDILALISRRMSAIRQYVIDEVTRDGLTRDLATNLVNTAIREQFVGGAEQRSERAGQQGVSIGTDTSYEEALRVLARRAESLRDTLVEDLVKSGLNRSSATELSDQALERIRRKSGNSTGTGARLTKDQIDLNASLDDGIRVVSEKVGTAHQIVLDELTRDGVPLRTAEQLLEAATTKLAKSRRKQ